MLIGSSHRGFTLIELLLVITIIAILAAILFPVFARVKAKARQTVCLSNLKQLGMACLMYAFDYDKGLPCDYYACNSDTTHSRLVQQILPYIEEMNILYCPSSAKIEKWMPDIVPPEAVQPLAHRLSSELPTVVRTNVVGKTPLYEQLGKLV